MNTKISGYRPLDEGLIAVVNENKEFEERVLRLIDSLHDLPGVDYSWLSIGERHIHEGFMAINRAVMRPGRVSLPEDNE